MTNKNDSQWEEYTEFLKSTTYKVFDGTLATSFEECRRLLDGWRRWLFTKLDEAIENNADTEWIEEQIEALQSAGDESDSRISFGTVAAKALNRWGTRYSMEGTLFEYGIIPEYPRWKDMGWTVERIVKDENGEEKRNPERNPALTEAAEDIIVISEGFLEAQAELGPDLCQIHHESFPSKEECDKFCSSVRRKFSSGDHSEEVLGTERDGNLYVAVILSSEPNWGHRKWNANLRDRHVNNALSRIRKAKTKRELDNHVRILRRYARDNQVLQAGHTLDNLQRKGEKISGRKVGIGFDYPRFATLMNALADRADELGFSGYRRYSIKTFEKIENKEGDIFEKGARQGEFHALSIADDTPTPESLWEQREGGWKPSEKVRARLGSLTPTGFRARTPDEILADVMDWLSK
jgi:hypothetical protein